MCVGSAGWGRKVPQMYTTGSQGKLVASKLTQRVRERSPLKQGKQHTRKINRKTRSTGETKVRGRGSPLPPQALAENRWARGRDTLRAHLFCASSGGGKEAQNERSNGGGCLIAHHQSLSLSLLGGRGGQPRPSMV